MTVRPKPAKLPRVVLPGAAWWRHPFVWLVVGLPAAAVVGSIVSAVIAISHADPVVDEYRLHLKHVAAGPLGLAAHPSSTEPAELARNHAATPRR